MSENCKQIKTEPKKIKRLKGCQRCSLYVACQSEIGKPPQQYQVPTLWDDCGSIRVCTP